VSEGLLVGVRENVSRQWDAGSWRRDTAKALGGQGRGKHTFCVRYDHLSKLVSNSTCAVDGAGCDAPGGSTRATITAERGSGECRGWALVVNLHIHRIQAIRMIAICE
jgi:hypothetical protein